MENQLKQQKNMPLALIVLQDPDFHSQAELNNNKGYAITIIENKQSTNF